MRKPEQSPEDEPEEIEGGPDGSPSFDDLMLLVFSGPMCFECLDEEQEEGEVETEGEVEANEKSN